ncbi:MAG: 50S ribosomal protein L29 [Candidatus Peregrinibacteria bacterium]
MKTLEELKKMSPEKLKDELSETARELFKAKFDIKNGQSKNNHQIKNNRKQVARIKTLINAK